MNAAEFAELVDWVQDRWGSSDEVWANSARFASDFTPFDAEDVWAALYLKGKGNWAPRPMELLDGARQQARNRAAPERQRRLPSSKGATWREWCMEKFGRRRSFQEVIRERHAELEGQLVEEVTEARLPGETGQIADGMRPKIQCRSPHCEIHNEVALERPDA